MLKNNKIVIYNFSKIGIQIAKVLLKKGYQIVIIDEEEENLALAKKNGYSVFQSDLINDDDIKRIGLAEDPTIKAFFCVTDSKNMNLFVTLSVRNLNKNLKIISVSFAKEDDKTILLAGANKVINPFEIGAHRIFRLLHKPVILDVLDNILFSESDIEVSEITIKKGSILDSIYLSDLELIHKNDIIILGIQDKELSNKFIFFSSGINHKIDAGDTIVLLGRSHELKKFKDMIHTII